METATLAGGCFWCTEAIFKRLKGVESVIPGYAGGTVEKPSYEAVTTGKTGHAEAIQIKFDPNVISFEKLLEVFWATHDPTTLNRQGADVGTQYRSAIFYHDQKQRAEAEKSIAELEKSGKLTDPVVTEVTEFTNFYPAEDYHLDYYDRNRSNNPYCPLVIDPKLQKLMTNYKADVKEEFQD